MAIRYWKAKYNHPPRDIQDLTYLLSARTGLEELKTWDNLTEGEAKHSTIEAQQWPLEINSSNK